MSEKPAFPPLQLRPTGELSEIQKRLDAVLAEGRQTMADMRAQGIVHFRTTWSEDKQQFVMEGSPVPFPPDEDDHFPLGMPYYARPSK